MREEQHKVSMVDEIVGVAPSADAPTTADEQISSQPTRIKSWGPSSASVIDLSQSPESSACAGCYLRESCLFFDLFDLASSGKTNVTRQMYRSGETIYTQGEKSQMLRIVRVGSVKVDTAAVCGTQQVQGFYLAGDIFGLDALATGEHFCSAAALEDTSVCSTSLPHLHSSLLNETDCLQRLLAVFAQETAEQLNLRILINHSDTMQRVAAFLLRLAHHMGSRSLSDSELNLTMSRYDIASYLGTTPETVSRALSKLMRKGLITVASKHVRINDHSGLARYAEAKLSGHALDRSLEV